MRPHPNVLMALPSAIADTSSECGSTTGRPEKKIRVRVETFTQEILQKPVPPSEHQEIIMAPPASNHYENSRFPPPIPPKRKESLPSSQNRPLRPPPLPPRKDPGSWSSTRSRSTLNGTKIGSPGTSLRGGPPESVESHSSDDGRRVRFEQWPSPPSGLHEGGVQSQELRKDDRMQNLVHEICNRAFVQK